MRTIALACGVLTAALILDTTTAAAHHSWVAEFAFDKSITLTGTVTTFAWTNPHSFLALDVKDPDTGLISHWTFQMGPPSRLTAEGWNRSSLKIGDVVTVRGWGARSRGDTFGDARTVTTPSGEVLLGASTAGGTPIVFDRLLKDFSSVRLRECPDAQALSAAADDILWLEGRLNQTGWTQLDREYEDSLDSLSDITAMAISRWDRNMSCVALAAVARDIKAKRDDCRTLGHSRTKLSVQIATVTSKQGPVSNWEVWVRWLPVGDRFTAEPRRLEGLSTPAKGFVPVAGEYELYARNPSTGVRTEPVRVSIAGKDPFTWPVVVPGP